MGSTMGRVFLQLPESFWAWLRSPDEPQNPPDRTHLLELDRVDGFALVWRPPEDPQQDTPGQFALVATHFRFPAWFLIVARFGTSEAAIRALQAATLLRLQYKADAAQPRQPGDSEPPSVLRFGADGKLYPVSG